LPVGRAEADEDVCGPYRVVRQIGSGGMASIFEALDTRLGHRVALKRLHPHIASRPGAAERFLREGRAAARIRHPHVVQVLASGTEDAGAYLAMELLEGSDLGALLAREGRLGVEAALELLLPAMAGVAAAHDAGVVHRDLKPSNIFVSDGPGGRSWPKVVDFGVSKVLEQDGGAPATATDGVVGTAAYMAPEQARTVRDASFQSDQYSLAVILYQCVTGKPPFATTGVYDLMVAIMTAPLAPPSQRAEGIPDGFDEVVLRAMSRDPRERFPSVRAFGAALLCFARERDRVAWSAELHDEAPGEPPVETGGEKSPKRAGTPARAADDPATMAPTARDTQAAARQHRRFARRALGALLASAAVAASALTWRAWQAPRPSPTDAEAHATGEPLATGRGPLAPPSMAPAATAPSSAPIASSTASSPGLPAPAPTSVRPWPARPQLRVAAAASASASAPSASLRIGDNGSPILP
jgi:tRNA A-37 threonylcarbamoyl transferase component Bud32